MTDKPTDAELDIVLTEVVGSDDLHEHWLCEIGRPVARAVLAKWGQPVVAGDVDRADAVNLARNALTQYDCAITKKGVRVLAEAVLSMDSALTTPQPTHAQAGAEPLTNDQVKAILVKSGYFNADAQHKAHFMNGIRHGEAAHGIRHGANRDR